MLEFADDLANAFLAWLNVTYVHAPVLVFGMSVLLFVPMLVLAGSLLRWAHAGERRSEWQYPGDVQTEPNTGALSLRPTIARDISLEVIEDASDSSTIASTHGFGRKTVLRIGRERDNDILLQNATVHGYHAVIQRSSEQGLTVSDLTDPDGNGVWVNGKRVMHAELRPGDEVHLGHSKLRVKVATQ